MRTFACFNELAVTPLCSSDEDADDRVRKFLIMLKEVRKHTHITKVRHAGDMTSIPLTASMTLQDYINTHTYNPMVRALLGIFTHPQVDTDGDLSPLERYFDTTTQLRKGDGSIVLADGFNAAYCQNTFCVGFESSKAWMLDFYTISVTSCGKTKDVEWVCISSPMVYSSAKEHVHRKPAIDRWLTERNVVLIETIILPENKPTSVEGDHGQELLKEHAKILNHSPYVEGTVTSLPFKPAYRDYILNVTDDGIVDIVLWWEDAGYSMRVKTTGRNMAETKEIARRLREKYGRKK